MHSATFKNHNKYWFWVCLKQTQKAKFFFFQISRGLAVNRLNCRTCRSEIEKRLVIQSGKKKSVKLPVCKSPTWCWWTNMQKQRTKMHRTTLESHNKYWVCCKTLIVKLWKNKRAKLLLSKWQSLIAAKGQLISKCPFSVKTSSKKPTKFFPGSLP